MFTLISALEVFERGQSRNYCIPLQVPIKVFLYICDCTWEKGPSRTLFQNRVIATAGKSRLLATKCATYLVMKAKCSGVIAISVHSFLSTAIS